MLSEAFVLAVMLLPCVAVADFAEAEESLLLKAFEEIAKKFDFPKRIRGANEVKALNFETVSLQQSFQIAWIMSAFIPTRISKMNDAKITYSPEFSTMVQEPSRVCQDIEITLVDSRQSSMQLHS